MSRVVLGVLVLLVAVLPILAACSSVTATDARATMDVLSGLLAIGTCAMAAAGGDVGGCALGATDALIRVLPER